MEPRYAVYEQVVTNRSTRTACVSQHHSETAAAMSAFSQVIHRPFEYDVYLVDRELEIRIFAPIVIPDDGRLKFKKFMDFLDAINGWEFWNDIHKSHANQLRRYT